MNDKLLSIDIYCLVHWYKEDTMTVVQMSSSVDGASVGDQYNVKVWQKSLFRCKDIDYYW